MNRNSPKILVLAFMAVVGFTSLAHSSDAPTPIDNFTFADGKELWDQGVMPDENKLVGTWNNIAWGICPSTLPRSKIIILNLDMLITTVQLSRRFLAGEMKTS